MKKAIQIILISFLVTSAYSKAAIGWDVIQYPDDIESIVIQGNVNLLIDGKSSKNTVKYKQKYATVTVQGKVLTIGSTYDQTADVSVRLFAAGGLDKMKSLTITDQSNMTARGLIGPQNINIDTSGRVLLEGYLSSPRIVQCNDANTEVLWLSGAKASLTVNSGYMKIAGNLKKAYVKTNGNAHVDGKHLRVDNLWLSTKGQSDISIYPAREFHVSATGESTVRSVYKPDSTSQFTAPTATVLYQSIFSS